MLLLMIVQHWSAFQKPPMSVHTWRQCLTLAVARNFHEESMNILRPRVDQRLDTDGITGMQFPSYEYVLALVYQLTGEKILVSRIFSLLLVFGSSIALYRIVLILKANQILAYCTAWLLPWSPDIFYHSVNALPDILALCAAMWSFFFYFKWRRVERDSQLWIGLLLITLAGLTKIQFLAFGIPLAIHAIFDLKNQKLEKREFVKLILGAMTGIGIVLSWYTYARILRANSGLLDVGLVLNPADSFSEGLSILIGNLISDLPELLLNYASFSLFLIGVYHVLKSRKALSPWRIAFMVWILALGMYHLIELDQMKDHAYYMMPYILPLLLVCSEGIEYLLRRSKIVLLILLVAQLLLAEIRIAHRWDEKNRYVPYELTNTEKLAILKSIPKEGLSIVGPDISGVNYFYFLDREGFSFAQTKDLSDITNGEMKIDNFISRGARYLFTSDTQITSNPLFLNRSDSTLSVGNFSVLFLNKD